MLQSPVPPLCDLECQRKKKREALKNAIGFASNPEQKYQAYQQYNTATQGQGWLSTEKESTAKRDIDLRLEAYINKYKELTEEQQKTSALGDLAKNLEVNEMIGKKTTHFLRKDLQREKDRRDVLDRMNILQVPLVSSSMDNTSASWLPWLFDAIILLLVGYLGYSLWTKYQAPILNTAAQVTTVAQQGVQQVSEAAGQAYQQGYEAASSVANNVSSQLNK